MQAAAKRLFTVVDSDEKKVRRICLCGTAITHTGDCTVCHPGTPWWKGLNEAEEGDEIEIALPNRTLHVTVKAIEMFAVPNIGIAA